LKTINYSLKEIASYIILKYKDSCLAYNGYEEGINDLIKFFYFEKLKWCGCGDPEIALIEIKDYLNIIYKYEIDNNDHNISYFNHQEDVRKRFGVNSIYDNPLLLCLAYSLDAAGFTEHGSSIGHPWMTEEGLMFLKLLNEAESLAI
jgi:hypothetical protein